MAFEGTLRAFERHRTLILKSLPPALLRRSLRGLDGEGADRAIINVTAAGGFDAAGRERPSYAAERLDGARSYLLNNRQHIRRKSTSILSVGF